METKTKYCILVGLLTNTGAELPEHVIVDFLAQNIESFSVSEQTGYWKGQREKSLCITIIGIESDAIKLEKLAKRMQYGFSQDSVYLIRQEITLFDINESYVPRETYNSKVTK